MHAKCNVHDDGRLGWCKRSFRSSQRSIRGGPTDRPTDVRPFDRETESARAAATVPASEPASQAGLLLSSPLHSPPFSPFLSVLPRVARRLKTLFCPHSKLDRRRRLHITYSYSIWTTKSSQQQKRASEPRTDCFRRRQTHPRADRHIT